MVVIIFVRFMYYCIYCNPLGGNKFSSFRLFSVFIYFFIISKSQINFYINSYKCRSSINFSLINITNNFSSSRTIIMLESDFIKHLPILDFTCVPSDRRPCKVSLKCPPSFYALYNRLIKM